MPDDTQDTAQKQVTLISTNRIRILNPRVRNRRTFEEMVENIVKTGLKRPITVAQRVGTDPTEYDLVCGYGRLEAFMELQQDAITAIIIDANESDCLIMSLVENCARRQHSPIDLMREIGNLRKRGYNDCQIAAKIGVTSEYVGMIAGLLERGEERLVSAVETGLLPLNLAIDISKTDAEGGQRALMDAYTETKLRGKKLAAVRRLSNYMLLDGHIRIDVLKDLGIKRVECLISKDDEAFTYNKRISRLAPIQEHKMIRKTIKRGVSEEKLALALDLSRQSIVRKAKLLDGICEEAVGILKDKPCTTAVFETLRRMDFEPAKAHFRYALGMPDAAIDVFTLANRRRRDRPDGLLHQIRYDHGVLYHEIGQCARAQREFERIYATDPDFEDIAKRLGGAC